MKNRILGITVLLAVVVLGLAFMSCPADTEDREITFTNRLSVAINVITDGVPASLPLDAAGGKNDLTKKGTVTKKGADIKLVNITSPSSGEVNSEAKFTYIDLDLSGISSTSKDKSGNYLLGSGSVVIKPQELNGGDGWGSGGNPIGFTKISVITPE